MILREIINNCIKRNQEVKSYLQSIDLDKRSPDQIIEELKSELPNFGYSISLQPKFSQLLQLLNGKMLIDEFDLEQIGELLATAIEIEEFNLDNIIEFAHYSWTVLDNEILARQTANNGIEKAKVAIKELESLIETMNIENQNAP
ncbi:MAG: hypothetical protein IPJ31_12700 [Bacteroidetes bacterium]|nr:hypothetical protein [Bacteroidota bacterium]